MVKIVKSGFSLLYFLIEFFFKANLVLSYCVTYSGKLIRLYVCISLYIYKQILNSLVEIIKSGFSLFYFFIEFFFKVRLISDYFFLHQHISGELFFQGFKPITYRTFIICNNYLQITESI